MFLFFNPYCLAFLVPFELPCRCVKMKSYEKIIRWGFFLAVTLLLSLELLNLVAGK